MNIQEVRTHIMELATTNVIPQADALLALNYLNNRNVHGAISCIISYI